MILPALLFSLVPTFALATSKRGLGYAPGSTYPADLALFSSSDSVVSWLYDWGRIPPANTGFGYDDFTPMQWNQVNIESFTAAVVAGGWKEILAFNEPDLYEQAWMNASYAAELWVEYLEPLRTEHGVRLGAPAVTSADSGRVWLQAFSDACNGRCNIDFLPLHYYGDDMWQYAWSFGQYLYSMHGQFPNMGNIWVTEFAATDTDVAKVESFMKEALDTLDGMDFVERYAWFGGFRGTDAWCLIHPNGTLTDLGRVYTRYNAGLSTRSSC